ncbi:acetylglutamate kinase [bacterium]|nr:acetylglutamate kinase [bacterium]
MKDNLKIAKTLIEALPYIQKFRGKTVVLKFGGSISSKEFANFSRDLVLMKFVGINPVVVHGGGIEITKALSSSNIKATFVNGLRVTCDKTMEIVEKVLVGKVNKQIVSKIKSNGGVSIGLSGRDHQLLKVKKVKSPKKGIDLGRVGEIIKVNVSHIFELQNKGYIPVIAPIGLNSKGIAYNINGDYAASKIASSLNAEKLIILTDVEGIKDKNNNLISSISKKRANLLIKSGVIASGMVPKVKCMIDALTEGVKKAHIIDGRIPHSLVLETFTDTGIGTEILL